MFSPLDILWVFPMNRSERAALIYACEQLRMETTRVSLRIDDAVANKNIPETAAALADKAIAATVELASYVHETLRADQ